MDRRWSGGPKPHWKAVKGLENGLQLGNARPRFNCLLEAPRECYSEHILLGQATQQGEQPIDSEPTSWSCNGASYLEMVMCGESVAELPYLSYLESAPQL